jgi:SAM-dependent methyltransferase
MKSMSEWHTNGLKSAPGYWRKLLTNKEMLQIMAADGVALDKPFALRSYLSVLIAGKAEAAIADIGAGAFSLIGHICEGCKVTLYPSDIYADQFRFVLDELGIVPIAPVEKQDMERLTYEDGFFDVVHCSNALDHCINPRLAIEEMIRVCKPGGYVYLRHGRNEGKREKYRNLHHWNIHDMPGGDCLFWEQDRSKDWLLSSVDAAFYTEWKKDWTGWDCSKITWVVSLLRKAEA